VLLTPALFTDFYGGLFSLYNNLKILEKLRYEHFNTISVHIIPLSFRKEKTQLY